MSVPALKPRRCEHHDTRTKAFTLGGVHISEVFSWYRRDGTMHHPSHSHYSEILTYLRFKLLLESIILINNTFENNLGLRHLFYHHLICHIAAKRWLPSFNPLTLIAVKSSLTILSKSFKRKQNLENIWWRNVNQNITNNSPSNILRNHSHFQNHHQKYHRSRRQNLEG